MLAVWTAGPGGHKQGNTGSCVLMWHWGVECPLPLASPASLKSESFLLPLARSLPSLQGGTVQSLRSRIPLSCFRSTIIPDNWGVLLCVCSFCCNPHSYPLGGQQKEKTMESMEVSFGTEMPTPDSSELQAWEALQKTVSAASSCPIFTLFTSLPPSSFLHSPSQALELLCLQSTWEGV